MTDQTSEDSIIKDVIEKDIIDLLELSNLPKEKQDEYRKIAADTIYDRAFTRITEELESLGAFDEFQEKANDEKLLKEFLSSHGIELEKVLLEETVAYKAQMKTISDLMKIGVQTNINVGE